MEILLVVVVLAVIAAAAFAWMRSRNTPTSLGGRGAGLRGPRRTRVAARHDPMAEVVERHAMATDPQEAAEAELRLQAQANRVAADLHAQQAAALESEAGAAGRNGYPRGGAYDTPGAYGGTGAYDGTAGYGGEPVYDASGHPVYAADAPPAGDERFGYDEHGRRIYGDDWPGYADEQPGYARVDEPAQVDEYGRPLYPQDRPRY